MLITEVTYKRDYDGLIVCKWQVCLFSFRLV